MNAPRSTVPAGSSKRRLLDRAPHPSRRAAVIALVLVVFAVALAFQLSDGGSAPRVAAHENAAGGVPAPDAVSSTWYCAEGNGAPGQGANETVWIANVGERATRADITVMAGGASEPSSRRVTVPAHGQVNVPVSTIVAAAEQLQETGLIAGPGVVVEAFGGRAVVEHSIGGAGEAEADLAVGPCAREPGRGWHFAAGTTERGADARLSLFNPFADDAVVSLSFATDGGMVAPTDLQSMVVPRRSRVTVPLADFVRRQAQLAAHVDVRVGRVVAEQSLTFTAENETRRGITLSLGAPAPARSWSLPGMTSQDGEANSVYVANFGSAATEVEVAPYLVDDSTVTPKRVAIAGRSSAVVDLGSFVAPGAVFDVEVRATHGGPVVAERLGTWGPPVAAPSAGTALGSTVPARAWVFATGPIAPDDAVAVSVFNPGPVEATARLVAYGPGAGGPVDVREVRIGAQKQATFDLAEAGVPPDRAVAVRSSAPVVATRRLLGPSGASTAPGIPDPYAR